MLDLIAFELPTTYVQPEPPVQSISPHREALESKGWECVQDVNNCGRIEIWGIPPGEYGSRKVNIEQDVFGGQRAVSADETKDGRPFLGVSSQELMRSYTLALDELGNAASATREVIKQFNSLPIWGENDGDEEEDDDIDYDFHDWSEFQDPNDDGNE